MAIILKLPNEIQSEIAERFKARRLSKGFTQEAVANRSGVSLGSLKRFERTAQVSLESLLNLALVLDELKPFDEIFSGTGKTMTPLSLDEVIAQKSTRKRGRLK